MDNIQLPKNSKRLSLPVVTKDVSSASFNRRHTLVPGRGILKAAMDENNTISVMTDILTKEKRRVSFAPEVTLHKINYSKANEGRKLKRRSSLTGTIVTQETSDIEPKLTTSRYLGKIYESPAPKKTTFEVTDENNQNSYEFLEEKQDQFIVDEETQTMEMSLELTNQIKKQQDVIRQQITSEENTQFTPSTHNSLRDLFEEVNQELNPEIDDLLHTDSAADQDIDSEEMDMTETFHIKRMDESEPKVIDEISVANKIDSFNVISDEDQTMEFTQPIHKDVDYPVDEESGTANVSEMELTQPVLIKADKEPLNEEDDRMMNGSDNEETMELTTAINEKFSTTHKHEDEFIGSNETLNKSSENVEENEHLILSENTSSVPLNVPNSLSSLTEKEDLQSKANSPYIDDANVSVVSDKDSSEMETSLIGTEMVPLAEVTVDMTETEDAYESDHSFSDDNYVNISLDVFLHDVNVQFFDKIGPSENEVDQTLAFNPEFRSSISLSPSSMSSSVTSTPSSALSSNPDSKSSIADLIDACANIPYYHYLVHLINQYKSSIQSISTMVNTFCNDLLESNPTAIREFYQQGEEIKLDLCTNYQALATVTRKQTKLQNIKFVSGLLEQLSLSYERVNETIETELSKTLDWRKSVLIERQKMIEKKVELDQELQKLNVLKDSFASIDMEKFMKNKAEIDMYEERKSQAKKKIAECDELINQKILSLDNKKIKKNQLLEDIKLLQEEVDKHTIPTVSDLELLNEKFSKLELEKDIKLIDSESQFYLFSERLQVQFKPYSEDLDLVMLSYKDSTEFTPFDAIADLFVTSNQKTIKHSEQIDELKKLVHSWKQFILLWKDLLMIHYLYSCMINDEQFEFSFDISNKTKHFLKFKVKGNTQHLFSSDDVPVTLERGWSASGSELQDNELLTLLNEKLDGKNVIVKRLTLML